MKTSLKKVIQVLIYFFTPEDSTAPIHKPTISFNIESGMVGIGSAKALFWLMNSMIFMYLISLL
ncbi:MAG: hypothetical protein HOG03_02385 [Desulfobacula sp.]|jgi:hypothetical protein|uniref:hypothetical protein n=1 Tax=Desulfobacula sp. TaxID=2593537 RepID=UPI001D2B4D28|nr:hypothetical protein [Desulfobacula sp.]MBT3486815.1 hypothetical protein [Desulfobacula sp.]MBT3803427.1 hypothetical protein [Desulfobacula sp.]MBT4024348.1 hypothetical protein [Desulfobacula sp.]MBT4199659.1 hypothetical protein [Desulfobacula sp.]